MKDLLMALKPNMIVITSDNIKTKILEELSLNKNIINIKFKNYSNFKKEILGEYNIKALLDLAKDENISYDLVNMKLSYTYFDLRKGISKKIDNLVDIKSKYYQNPKYFNYNKELINNYTNHQVLFINYDYNDDLLNLAKKKIEDVTKVIIYSKEKINEKIYLSEFSNIKEEAFYLVKKIASLIHLGKDIKNIKINNVNDSFYPILKEALSLYNIDSNLSKDITLYELEYVKELLKILKNNFFNDCYSGIQNSIISNLKKINSDDYEKLISLLNDFSVMELKVIDIYDLLTYKLKNTKVSKNKYSNVISFNDLNDDILLEGDHIFFPTFNQDILPHIHKDDGYLLDKELEELNLNTSSIKNQNEKERLLKLIDSCKNVYLSYSLSSMSGEMLKSSFLNSLNDVIEIKDIDENSYSDEVLKLEYFKELDNFNKYNVESVSLRKLEKYFKDYKKYDYSFKGLDSNYYDYIKEGIYLSYTSIDSFYNCPFKYYLERVLKVSKNNNNDSLIIGNLFHYVLYNLVNEKVDDLDLFIDSKINEFYNNENILRTKKDEVFINIYKDVLKKNYLFLEKQKENSEFTVSSLEKEYQVIIDKGVSVYINGKIDKVLTLEAKGKKYAIVVDYKTGSSDFSFDYVKNGLSLQLLFYYMFLKEFEDIKFGGAYLASTLPFSPFKHEDGKKYDELLEEHFLLNGYSNEEIIGFIDKNVKEDSYLKGISYTKDGKLTKRSINKILTEGEFDIIYNIALEKIQEAIDNIINGNFIIEPKKIKDDLTCKNCPYKEICFVKEDAYLEIKESKDLSFIRGNKNE